MEESIMGMIWFCLCFLALYSSIICVNKTEEKQNGVVWGIMSFIVVLCFHGFAGAILNMVRIPLNIWSIGAADILSGGFIWFRIIRSGKRQQYSWRKRDGIALIILMVPVIYAALCQFGPGLNMNYIASDGCTHYRMALEVVKSQSVKSMFFAPLNNALFLEIFENFFKATQLYRVFILSDILMFYLAGAVFYALLADKANTRGKWGLAVGITIIYMMGYPHNNLVYGFNYLGISIILIIYLAWVIQFYFRNDMDKNLSILLLSLGCYGVGICYSMFAPVVFMAVCLAVSSGIWKNRRENSKWFVTFIVDNLKIFLIPCILVIIYSLIAQFGSTNVGQSIGGGLAMEGGIYRDLFSNFIFWLPFALFGIYLIVKNREDNLMISYSIFLIGFMLILGYGGLKGEVSSYYYFKNYFFASAIVFYLAFCGIAELLEKHWQYVAMQLAVYGLLAFMTIFHVEEKIQAKNILFAPVSKSQYYFDIYVTNQQLAGGVTDYSRDKLDLYEYCYDEFQDEKAIIVCGQDYDVNVFRAVTQRISGSDFVAWITLSDQEKKDLPLYSESAKKKLKIKGDSVDLEAYYESMLETRDDLEKEIPFVYLYNQEEDLDNLMAFKGDDIEILYENSAGFVAIMKNCSE